MSRLRLGFAVFTILFGLEAFGDALTPLQKQLTLNTLQSYALASAVARTRDPNNLPPAPPSGGLTPLFYLMVTKIDSGVTAGDCVLSSGNIASTTGNCPVLYSQIAATTNYNAITPNFSNLNDVTSFSTNSTWNSDGTITGQGMLGSQTVGNLAMTIAGTWTGDGQTGVTVSADYTITFPAYTAVFSIREFAGPTSETVYTFLNGVQLTPAEQDFVLLSKYQPQPKAPPPPSSRGQRQLPPFL